MLYLSKVDSLEKMLDRLGLTQIRIISIPEKTGLNIVNIGRDSNVSISDSYMSNDLTMSIEILSRCENNISKESSHELIFDDFLLGFGF